MVDMKYFSSFVLIGFLFIVTFFDSFPAIKTIYLLEKNKKNLLHNSSGKQIKTKIHQLLLKHSLYLSKKDIISKDDSSRKKLLSAKVCNKKADTYVWISLPLYLPLKGKTHYQYCVVL